MNFLSVLYAKAGITVDGVTTLNNTATALTPATNDNSTKIATTAFVKNQNYYPYPTGTTAQYVRGDGSLATFPTTIQQAQRLITEVYNETGATLTKGTVVYINGGHGNLPTVTKALANSDATSAQTYGVVQSDITDNNNGFVVVVGSIIDLDTFAYANGTILYLSPTTAGAWTSTKPYAPQHIVYVGIVTRQHPTQGVVEIKIQNGYEMDELHNVSAQNPANGDILQFNYSTQLWTKTAGTTTNITEGTNLYFTDARARAAITLTTSGTSGAATYSGGVLNIPQYQAALTNPITGTGTTNYLPKFTGASALGDSIISEGSGIINVAGNVRANNTNGVLTLSNGNTSGGNKIQSWNAASNADGYLAFEGYNIEYGRFDASGRLGIGTTSPNGKLQVKSDTNQNLVIGTQGGELSFEVVNDAYSTNTPIRYYASTHNWYTGGLIKATLDANGSLGIGTTSPAAKLDVDSTGYSIFANNSGGNRIVKIGTQSSSGEPAIQATLSNGTARYLMLNPDGGNILIGTTGDAGYKLQVNGQASIGSGAQAIVGTDGTYAGYSTIGFGGTTNGYNRVFGNSGLSDGLFLAAATGKGIDFWTNGEYSRMVITSGGNVLIGTYTDSGYKLDVNGTARVSGALTANGTLTVNEDGASTKIITIRSNWAGVDPAINVTTNNSLLLMTNNTERMRITSAGNFGFGTATSDVFGRGYSGTILGISSAGQSAIELNSATGNAAYFDMGVNGTRYLSFYTDTSSSDISTIGAFPLTLSINSVPRLTIASSGAATFSSSVAGTSFTANNRTILTSGGLYDNATNGNNIGIGFGASFLISTDGAGTYSAQNLGNSTYPWYSAYFASTITATQGVFSQSNASGITSNLILENFISTNPGSGNGVAIDFKLNNNGNPSALMGKISLVNTFYRSNSDMIFSVALSDTLTERMRIASSGNILINTTTDADYKLDVFGTARFTGQVVSNTQFYAVGTPPVNSGALMNIRDTNADGSNVSFGGVFFNSSPGTDFSIGKLSEYNNGFLQIRNGNNGAELLRINSTGAALFSSQLTAKRGLFQGSTGETLTAQGVAGEWVANLRGAASTGNSYGLVVAAGTNASDLSFAIYNQAVTSEYFKVRGDGAATFSSSVTTGGSFISNVINNYGLILNRSAITTYNGISLQTAGSAKWFLGMRENLSSNNYIIYSEQLATDILTLNIAIGAATFSSSVTATTYYATDTRGIYVNSGSASYLEANSTNNWAYLRLSNNGTVIWDIASYNGGALEFRPGGGSSNAITMASTGRVSSVAWTTTGRNYSNEWIEFPNYSGLYSPNNEAHFYPNNGSSYGAWAISGTRNSYGGISFNGLSNGNVILMVYETSVETGFYNQANGWQFRWTSGTLYVGKGTYGGGTNAVVLDAVNYNSYAPTLTGTGASGTWGISITGNANYATTAGALTSMNISQFTNDAGYITSTSSTFSYTASVTLSPTWQNTGVSSANLTGSGVYIVTCNANDFGVSGGQYNCTYTGIMYWFAGGTNGSNVNEIVLHHTGHADNGRYIYLRTLSTVTADGKTYLQISGNGTNSGASNYQLTFKKIL